MPRTKTKYIVRTTIYKKTSSGKFGQPNFREDTVFLEEGGRAEFENLDSAQALAGVVAITGIFCAAGEIAQKKTKAARAARP